MASLFHAGLYMVKRATRFGPRKPTKSPRVGSGSPRQEADHGDKERGADDRPDNRKRHFADLQREQVWQRQNTSEPHADQGADETEHDGHQTAAARIAADG